MTLENRPSDEPDSGVALSRLEGIVEELEAAPDKAARLTVWARVFEGDLIVVLRFAALDYPQQMERLLLRIEKISGMGGKAAALRKTIGRGAGGPAPDTAPLYSPPPGEAVALPEGTVIPVGYAVTSAGTWRETVRGSGRRAIVEWARVARQAIAVRGASADVDGGGYGVRLAWSEGDGLWAERLVPRTIALSAGEILQISAAGLLVSSDSAREVVAYLEAAIAATSGVPVVYTSRSCGWQAGGFLLGTRFYGPEGEVTPPPVSLDTVGSPGAAQQAAGYGEGGTWEGWCTAIRRAARYPRLGLTLLCSLVPPLLKLIPGARNFLLDLYGTTSEGKSTALRVGASPWGLPDDGEGGLINAWENTKVWAERAPALSSDLPLILDDSQRANHADLTKIVYSIAQGRGKGRGSLGGMAATATWRTVALSTGEAALTSYSEAGGASARTLALWGSPLGGQSDEAGVDSRALKLDLLTHYGHAGPRLLVWLQQPGRREELIGRYAAHLERYAGLANGNAVANRAAESVALIALAQDCARAIGVPELGEGPLDEAWRALVAASVQADRAAAALRLVFEWAAASPAAFYGRHATDRSGDPVQPAGGWRGAWQQGDTWDRIGFYADPLLQLLKGRGYDAEAMLLEWRDRGWLKVNTGGNGGGRGYPMNVAGERVRLIVVLRAGFLAVGGDNE